jgi:uncharacterized protein (TIGR03067 family)
MRMRLIAIAAVALCLAPDAPIDAAKEEQEKLQGVWALASSERDGRAEPGDAANGLELEFAADTFRFRLPAGARHPQPYKLDPGAKPKAIDWLAGGKHGPSKSLLGIYELDGDTLEICWGNEGGERPKEFVTGAGKGVWRWALKRKERK